jgi:hypothetical protein
LTKIVGLISLVVVVVVEDEEAKDESSPQNELGGEGKPPLLLFSFSILCC